MSTETTNHEQPVSDPGSMESRVADALLGPEEDEQPVEERPFEKPPELEEEEPNDDSESDEEEGESDDDDESEPESEFVEVEFDGKEYRVPPELKDALMRTADYTRKTTELANERQQLSLAQKALEQHETQYQFANAIQGELSRLNQADALLAQYDQLDWANMTTDELVRTKHDREQVERERARILEGVQAAQREFDARQEQAVRQLLSEGQDYLSRNIDGWSPERATEIGKFGLSLGYTPEEMSQLYDIRHVRVLDMAKRWADLQSKGHAKVRELADVPPIMESKPVNRMPESVKKDLKFRKDMKKAREQGEVATSKLIQERLANKFG